METKQNIIIKLEGLSESKLKQILKFVESTSLGGSDFEVFWKSYPRKIGKGAAKRKWDTKKPPIDQVLKSIDHQKKEWTDPQFIPHPTTWLNQDRWEDEIPDKPTIDLMEWNMNLIKSNQELWAKE